MSFYEQCILEMTDICKEFEGNIVLKDICLSIKRGEIIGLVGENGAGKSTLMNILFGAAVINESGGYSGKIIFDGKEVKFSSPFEAINAGIGMIHQEFSLIPEFTTTENILLNREPVQYNILSEVFGEKINLLNKKMMAKRAIDAIKMLEVEIDPNAFVKDMPVGQKQFIEIAREIDRKSTKLLILDEPTAVLSESEANIVIEIIKKLADKGIAIIFISHRLDEIFNCCNRIIVLRDGTLQKTLITSDTNHIEVAKHMIGNNNFKKNNSTFKVSKKSNKDILQVNNLWVDMPGEQVKGVTFRVKEGEIFGFGGLTGQGKLGIANGILGIYKSKGEVKIKNRSIPLNNTKYILKNGVSFVSEDRRGIGLLVEQPIFLNIGFMAMQINNNFIKKEFSKVVKWRDDKEMIKIASEYIKSLRIRCVNERQIVRELSGGNQQKILIAKALALKPEIIFVSEPTRGIDVGAKELVLNTLIHLNREYGTTIIITSSELDELISLCDEIAIINEGKIAGILPATADRVEFGLLMLGSKDVEIRKKELC